ncbi:TATA box-binding protein-associated factor RNA polymerase I subunit B [Aplysia californica]|uniref:TATA box-binding protein-associated factor RNA polymerase I subunit B n=1 Tax=Aplysia californica TaxID=6500 RepID=A0ABM0JUG1_APLCA|nr:TATA box-binding protein-associated factor RNA polymerase I subunit B [Aplysia californica]
MPFSCGVCGNSEYDEEDGLFFCTECGTQSEELIVKESHNDDGVAGALGHEVKVLKSQETPTTSKKSKLGRPWTIYEGFQYILIAQAEALINLGADITLQETAFAIWANYLSKLGIAFCKKEKVVPDLVKETKIGRLRELHRGTFDNPLNHQSPFTLKKGKKIAQQNRAASSVDPCTAQGADLEDLVERVEEGFIDEEEGKLTDYNTRLRIKKNTEKSPQWMCMPKTLAICYIGLMISNPRILPCDVIRWVYDGKIPYLSATDVLPEDLVFSQQDANIFSGDINVCTLLTEVNRLMKYLGIHSLSTNCLQTVIRRFVDELSLPGDMKGVCCKLMEEAKYRLEGKRDVYRKQELLAVAYIVTALRMIFSLDGKREKHLSAYSEQVQGLIGSDPKLFVWNNWRKYQNSKPHLEFSAVTENCKDISKSTLMHLDPILEWFKGLNRDKRKVATLFSLYSETVSWVRATPEFLTALQRPLEQAHKKLKSSHSREQDDKASSQEERVPSGEQFRQSTLCHLVNIPKLREKIQHLDPAPSDTDQLEDLLQRQTHCPVQMPFFHPVTSDQALMRSRPRAYIWLLQLCCDVIYPGGGPKTDFLCTLDQQVIKVQEALINPPSRKRRRDSSSDREEVESNDSASLFDD